MEVSDLVTLANRLSCEDARLELPPNQNPNDSPELTLLAKLITSNDIRLTYVKDITLKALKPVYPMEVKKLDKTLFTFSFQHEVDLHKAFSMRPWSCKGAHIGQVLEVDIVGETGGCRKKFLRIRVDIQIEKPLTPGFFLPRPNRSDAWIGFKYEKLADCCYKYGVIGHEEKSYTRNFFQLRNLSGFYFNAAGLWLRPGNDDIPTNLFTCPEVPSSDTTNTDPPPAHSSVTPSITVPSTQPRATHTTKYCMMLANSTTRVPTHRTWKAHNNPTTPVPPVTQATTNKSWHFALETHIGPLHHPQAGPVEDMAHLNTLEKEQLFGPHSLIQLTPVQAFSQQYKPWSRARRNPPLSPEDKSKLLNPSLSTLSSFSPSSPDATHPHSAFVSDNSLLQTNETTTPHLPNLLKRKSTPNATEAFSKHLKKDVYGPEPIYFDPDSTTLFPQSELEHLLRNESHKFKVGEPMSKSFFQRVSPPCFHTTGNSIIHFSTAEEAGLTMPPQSP
nr:hypothetical protein CFP56_12590 [Quercus suber]